MGKKTYTLPNVDGSMLSSIGPLIMALQAGQAGNWARERKILQNQRKAEAKRNQREVANQEAQAKQLQDQQAADAQRQQVQSGLQVATGGATPVSMASVRSAAAATPSMTRVPATPGATYGGASYPTARPVVPMPTAPASPFSKPFTYVPDLTKLSFGGRM